jgi:hypothetical protein
MLNTGKSDSSTSKSIVEEVDRKERSQKESQKEKNGIYAVRSEVKYIHIG